MHALIHGPEMRAVRRIAKIALKDAKATNYTQTARLEKIPDTSSHAPGSFLTLTTRTIMLRVYAHGTEPEKPVGIAIADLAERALIAKTSTNYISDAGPTGALTINGSPSTPEPTTFDPAHVIERTQESGVIYASLAVNPQLLADALLAMVDAGIDKVRIAFNPADYMAPIRIYPTDMSGPPRAEAFVARMSG